MAETKSWHRRGGVHLEGPAQATVPGRGYVGRWARLATAALLPVLAACELLERPEPPVPDEAEVAAYFQEHNAIAHVELHGNLVEIAVVQPYDQIRRGGSLWAKVGPYVYVFSPAARNLLTDHPGVAAVRVVTQTPDGREVARATLMRDALSEFGWRRAQNLLGHALQEGTQRPRRLEQLVEWGEEHTEYRYGEAFVSNAR